MRVAIVGSRSYSALWRVTEYVKSLPSDSVVISGGARGVDKTAEVTASAYGLGVCMYPVPPSTSRWDFTRKAYARNQVIVDDCDRVVAFWDGISPGTHDTLNRAQNAHKPILIIYPTGKEENR